MVMLVLYCWIWSPGCIHICSGSLLWVLQWMTSGLPVRFILNAYYVDFYWTFLLIRRSKNLHVILEKMGALCITMMCRLWYVVAYVYCFEAHNTLVKSGYNRYRWRQWRTQLIQSRRRSLSGTGDMLCHLIPELNYVQMEWISGSMQSFNRIEASGIECGLVWRLWLHGDTIHQHTLELALVCCRGLQAFVPLVVLVTRHIHCFSLSLLENFLW